MNILLVLPSFHTNLYYALKALYEAGHRVHLVCTRRNEGAEAFIDTHTIIEQDAATFRDVAALVARLSPDLVVIRKTGRLSKLVHRACLLQRRKAIAYDQRPYLQPRHRAQVIHGVLKGRPMHRITPVHGLAGSGRPDPRATYLPFPVEAMPEHVERDYAPGGTIRILCVGKLTEERKNQFLLLRALEPFAANLDFRVTFVGSSSLNIQNPSVRHLNALHDYATNGPLATRVTITPDIPFSEMTGIYRTHDICVLPSRAEPLGTAPLEAMAQGCAAIVSSDAGSSYYVQGAAEAGLPCGAVFESGDQEALRRTLGDTFYHIETLANLGRNAAKWARLEFSLLRFVERFRI